MSETYNKQLKVLESSNAYIASVEVLTDFKEHFKRNRKIDYFEACKYLGELSDKYYAKFTESRKELAKVDADYAQHLLETGGEQV